jgi:hypothetical protein
LQAGRGIPAPAGRVPREVACAIPYPQQVEDGRAVVTVGVGPATGTGLPFIHRNRAGKRACE